MNKLLTTFIDRFGYLGYLRVVLYPLTTLLVTPLRLIQALWNCRVLIRERWREYNHFNPYSGLDYLVYWTGALILSRFGRNGTCPYIGIGDYPLSRVFHYCKFSLYSYWKASNITLLLGMFGWAFIHFVWIGQVSLGQLSLIIFLTIISTTFYSNTFTLQNYNVLGWLFFPLGLYGILTENWIIAALAWFLASFSSFTVVSMAGIISIVVAIVNASLLPVLALIPAGLKIFVQIIPFFVAKNIKVSFLHLLKAIGFKRKNVQYRRRVSPKAILISVYFLLIYIQFAVIVYIASGKIPVLFLAGLLVFIVNSSPFMRFADRQSPQMLIFSLAMVYALRIPDPRILISFWLVISPLPLLIPFPYMKKVLDVVPEAEPFSIKKVKAGLENFLAEVNPGERVFMAFDDPKGIYGNIFSGYRVLLQPILYVAAEKKISFMPDWWGVFELNYEGAPDFWGRDLNSLLKNVKFWKADYAVVYQDEGRALKPDWELAGFKVLAKFSWASYEKELRGVKPYSGKIPDWWLLKVP